ncbi:MAG: GAF domain-containing protein [Fidelibacterota bacterium]|nr:MAG: GAF domain-containing protein [Candidatus Neomarinimicrobiota bacterium]
MISLEFLQKIGAILQQSLSDEETYSAVFNILDEVIEYDAATLFVIDPDTEALNVAESRGSQVVNLASDVSFTRGGGLSGWVASQREPIILSTMSGGNSRHDFKSLISIPLWAGDALEGVLNLGHRESGFYKPEHKPDLQQLGTQVSLIVEQLRLRAELHEKNKLLESAIQELQETQNALVEKERLAAMGQLVVRVNHEINNPLTIILSFLDVLMKQCGDDHPDVADTITKMREAADRIQELTKKLENLQTYETEEYLEGVKMLKLN